jgi:hypothetical protein
MSVHTDNTCDERISMAWTAIGCLFLVALLVLLNGFPSLAGVWVMIDGVWHQAAVVSPEFFQSLLPWVDAWLGLALALSCIHLFYGRWLPLTRWADLGLTIFGLVVLLQLIQGGPILVVTPEFWPVGEAVPAFVVPSVLLRVALWFALIGTAIGVVVRFVRLLQDAVRVPARRSA